MDVVHRLQPHVGIVCRQAATERELARYRACIEAAGGSAVLLRPGERPPLSTAESRPLAGLLLIGGGDIHPRRYGEEPDRVAGLRCDEERDEVEFGMLEWALRLDLPVLGICRGMQVLNVAFGGKLLPDIPGHRIKRSRDSAYHAIDIVADSRLARLAGLSGRVEVNSRHHQGVAEATLAPGLVATAHRPDDGLIEALESPKHRFVVGVQCHPERSDEVDRRFQSLFEAFVAAC